MADDSDDILEKWMAAGRELLEARKGSAREAAFEQRIAGLEERFKDQPLAEQQDALGDLTEAERKLISDHRAGRQAIEKDTEQIEREEKEDKPTRKTRPGRKSGSIYEYTVDGDGRVQRVDIPTVYSGADEPDEVELPDDEEQAA